jgi:hypothetical protein
MALDKQKIAMPIVDGIDTKGDDKTVLPTRFLELENVVFTSPGSLQKRFGYQPLPNKDLDNNKILTGSAISSFRDELLLYSNSNLYAFSEGEQKWEGKGEIRFCNSSSLQISAENQILENPSSYTYENVTCYAYEKRNYTVTHNPSLGPDIYDENKTVQIIIVDNINNTILAKHDIDGEFIAAGGSFVSNADIKAPKVGFAGSNFIITVFANTTDAFGGGIRYLNINYLSPKVVTLQTTKIQDMADTSATNLRQDIVSFSNRCFFAYTTLANDTELVYIASDLSLSTAASLGTSYVLNNVSISEESGNLRIFTSKFDGTLATAYLFNFSLTTPVHPSVVITYTAYPDLQITSEVYTITGCQDPQVLNQSRIMMQVKNFKSELGVMYSGTINSAGVLTTGTVPAQVGVEIQSKPIALDSFVYYFASKNIDPTQTSAGINTDADTVINKPVRTLYLFKNSTTVTEIVAQFEVDTNVFVNSDYLTGLPNCDLINEIITLPVASITSLQPAGAARLLANSVIKKLSADFSQTSNYFDASQGEALHISGGLLKMYDGYRVVEHGFLDTPDPLKEVNLVSDLYANISSGISAGNKRYLYTVVYKWVDRTGKIHRSAPANPIDVTTPAGSGFYNVNLTFTPLYLTDKETAEIEIYRTQGDGTIFYKLSKVVDAAQIAGTDDYITGAYPNNKNAISISITDSVTDAELAFAEPLYTTGGILENDAALSSYFVANYKSRLFLILSDGYTLQYSKVTGIGEPVRFNANFKIPLDDKGGKAVALAVMDDHLIIFKERAIFALTGEGPNELGQQDDYRNPYSITTDAGCIDPNSIVDNPNGIMFKSAKGIYMLKRNFGLQYIGDSVEKYNSQKIVSATLLATVNQIRLITDAGITLVYDYYSNRWTTFTNTVALDSIEFKGDYYFVKADGLVMKETPGLYQDNGQFIKMKIKSAWIQIAGVQGFERFYNMLLLGNYLSAHKLQVKFAYDFNPYYQQETIIDSAVLAPSTYGSESPYGSGVYGGQFPLYQWLVYPKIQKCQSFQFELSDVKTETDGASFLLSHIMAEVGIKSGGNKKADTRSFGTK